MIPEALALQAAYNIYQIVHYLQKLDLEGLDFDSEEYDEIRACLTTSYNGIDLIKSRLPN